MVPQESLEEAARKLMAKYNIVSFENATTDYDKYRLFWIELDQKVMQMAAVGDAVNDTPVLEALFNGSLHAAAHESGAFMRVMQIVLSGR